MGRWGDNGGTVGGDSGGQCGRTMRGRWGTMGNDGKDDNEKYFISA